MAIFNSYVKLPEGRFWIWGKTKGGVHIFFANLYRRHLIFSVGQFAGSFLPIHWGISLVSPQEKSHRILRIPSMDWYIIMIGFAKRTYAQEKDILTILTPSIEMWRQVSHEIPIFWGIPIQLYQLWLRIPYITRLLTHDPWPITIYIYICLYLCLYRKT